MPKSNVQQKVLPLSQDPQVLELVRSALVAQNGFVMLEPTQSSKDILEDLDVLKPDFILLDYENGIHDPLNLISSISVQFPAAVIISILPQENLSEVPQVILSGARAFLIRPFGEEEFLKTLHRISTLVARTRPIEIHTREADAEIRSRGTICVFSPKGGVGCSTIAANLALSLQQSSDEEVLLIDGKLVFGHLDMMLSLRAQNSIADLSGHDNPIDEDTIRGVVSSHVSGLDVLTSPSSLAEGQEIKPEDLFNIITSAQAIYSYIVIDAGCYLNENVVTFLDASNKILLVINPEITSLRDASQFFDICRGLAYPPEKLVVVVNRISKQDGLSLKDIEKSLQHKVFATIPWQRKESLQSVNSGKPVVLQNKNGILAKTYRRFGEDIIQLLQRKSAQVIAKPAISPLKHLGSRLERTFKALRNKDYRYFFFGQILSLVGNWMQIVAQGWLVYRITDSPLMLGLVNLVGLLPVVPISLISGVISDRFSRKKLILFTEVVMMAQAFAFAILIWRGTINVWHVMALSFVLGAAAALEQPARLAIIANLVGREDLTNAVALNAAVYNSARIIGPAIAGFIVAFWGEASCFLINGISFSGVIIALFLMKMPARVASEEKFHLGQKMVEGLKFIWDDKNIRALLTIVAYSSFLTLPYVALMPAFAKDVLKVGSDGLGLLMTGIGIGALVGALRIASVPSGKRGVWLTVGNVLGPALLIGFTFTRSYFLALILVVLIGGSNAIRQALANSLIQLSAKPEYHGRVMSVFNLLFNGMSRVGALLIGGLAEVTGIASALGAGGVLSLGISLMIVWRMSYVHKIP